MRTVPLGEVAAINPKADQVRADETISFVGMAELDAEAGIATPLEPRAFSAVSKGYTVFRDRDILAAKITPCWENAKVGQARLDHPIGVGSTEFHVLRPGPDLDERFLLHFLRQPIVRAAGELRMTGSAGQRRVPVDFLKQINIPLPDPAEQRRIAAILDQADTLRAKRRQGLAHLDALPQAIFQVMFAAQEYGAVPASTLMPSMRNGLSPATAGTYSAQVLTLSAVTQGEFNPSAVKAGSFATEPPGDKRVSARDFLMCRGNGNRSLVGVGTYSQDDRLDLVFPDTIIAGTVDTRLVTMAFLSAAWLRNDVRRQIESVARTTNGTYKVNQQTLGGITVPLPPLASQQEFSAHVEETNALRANVQRALAADDVLFASLQSRAFRGEL